MGKNVANILVWNVISNFFYQIVVKIKTEVKHTLTMRHYIANFPIETKSINFHCALKLSNTTHTRENIQAFLVDVLSSKSFDKYFFV